AKIRRLLCVLFLRLGPVSADTGQTGRCAAVTPRRFPAPWSAELQPNCFIVRDAADFEQGWGKEAPRLEWRAWGQFAQQRHEDCASHCALPSAPARRTIASLR